jgi:hypothetical protein
VDIHNEFFNIVITCDINLVCGEQMTTKICSKCKIEKQLKDFSIDRDKKYGVRNMCRICDQERKKKYLNTEKGFLNALYNNMSSRTEERVKNNEKRGTVQAVDFTFEEFLQMWEEHKIKYGPKCPYTEVDIFCKRIKNEGSRPKSQVSTDRIDNNIPYTKKNIIFCSSHANWVKGQVTIDMCKKILNLYNERNL